MNAVANFEKWVDISIRCSKLKYYDWKEKKVIVEKEKFRESYGRWILRSECFLGTKNSKNIFLMLEVEEGGFS